ncbi:MAG: citramalate synthase [Oscillospiraceae bacterium]|jgi:2-isopropylmalate synthase|nr:citramalate synthase [Oscillospiraceae bacterium]
MRKIAVLDTTLRDGAQGVGVQFSVDDRLAVARLLDDLGVDYIEAGQPSASLADADFFARRPVLKHAKLTAFGATARKGVPPEADTGLAALLAAETGTVTLFGKASRLQVETVLRCGPEENLIMIEQSVAFLKSRGREVIYDAEHFFGGYREDPGYALETLYAARRGGADTLVLCDTVGGALPDEIERAVRDVCNRFTVPIGIHTHNDGGMAAANSVVAVLAGASHVQGTIGGIGERCGNADLVTVIAGLQLKRDTRCIPDASLPELTRTARAVADIANLAIPQNTPYVGENAFVHKAGMHIDGVMKIPAAFEHVSPTSVGNRRGFAASELAGRSFILRQVQHVFPGRVLDKDSPEIVSFMEALKEDARLGVSYEAAEASLNLRIVKHFGAVQPAFDLTQMRVIAEHPAPEQESTAILNLRAGGRDKLTAGQGYGPVHALEQALTKALEGIYPEIKDIRLTDYKVRVLNPDGATAARVRVLITSTDGASVWSTVGVSDNIVWASWQALSDSVEYFLWNRRTAGWTEK